MSVHMAMMYLLDLKHYFINEFSKKKLTYFFEFQFLQLNIQLILCQAYKTCYICVMSNDVSTLGKLLVELFLSFKLTLLPGL